jgi:protein DEK
MSEDTENGVASPKSREETKKEKKEKTTPRKRVPSEKKEGERKSERTPKQISLFQPPEPKDTDAGITIPAGKGTPIGDIPNCVTALKSYKVTEKFLGKLHRLMFGVGGKKKDFKQNIRQFKGFAPGEDRAKLLKKTTQSKLEVKDLRPMCHVLDLDRAGTRDELIESLVDFLLHPKNSGNSYKNKESGGSKKKGQKRKSSSKKESNRAPSGYMMFVKVKRNSVVAKHPEASFGEIGKRLGKKWNKLSDTDKADWAEKGRKQGPSQKEKKKSSSKKSKKENSSSDEASSSSEEEEDDEDEALSDAIRAKIKFIVANGPEASLTIRQIKEQLRTDFADEVEKKGVEIKAFVHKYVANQS